MPNNVKSKANTRKLWLNTHLYLGLIFGLFFVMTGITGSILAFYVDIDELLNPELVIAHHENQHKQSYETLFQALKTAEPSRDKAWRLELPDNPNRMVTARYYKPEETKHLDFAPLIVSVNPYTAEVVASRFWGEFAMTWIYDLHYTLLLNGTGRVAMSIIGIFIFLSLCTGIYLWWPTKHTLKTAFSFKRHTSSKRNIYDIHKLSGVYSLPILVIVVVTGVLLGFPYVEPAVQALSPLYKPASTSSILIDNGQRLPVDKIVDIAQQQFPKANVKWIETPNGITGSYRINLRQEGEPSQRFPKTNVWLDQYSGKILAIRDIHKDGAGDTFLRWLHPLHTGQAFGLTGRIIVCISGLLPVILFVTGYIRWRQKQRKKTNVIHKFS
ncbi:hypothetical protein LCGC14_1379830 [marine sediment metagenome]|uniref:PepSY domain-containing protein n=1 Tax=marine sediment metagenome TaxID=412755 RepID=A0A0F9K3D8_9ZZZZ|nr:PepSY domain-containing protein [Methylophaga sp.]HEC60002.1 PepSY domain-containing protein [Methylophaga sp.]